MSGRVNNRISKGRVSIFTGLLAALLCFAHVENVLAAKRNPVKCVISATMLQCYCCDDCHAEFDAGGNALILACDPANIVAIASCVGSQTPFCQWNDCVFTVRCD